MIPRLLHFCYHWQPLPDWAQINIDEFAARNPEFEIRVWRSVPEELPQELAEASARAPSFRFRSDLIRYWILQQYGGVYVDVDCRPMKHFDEALLGHDGFLAAYSHQATAVDNFFMGSVAGFEGWTPVLERCLNPDGWHDPIYWFGTRNVMMTAEYVIDVPFDVLDPTAAENLYLPQVWHELTDEPRVPLQSASAYVRHYGVHGQRERILDGRNGVSLGDFEPEVIRSVLDEWNLPEEQRNEKLREYGLL